KQMFKSSLASSPSRFFFVLCGLLLLVCMSAASFGQTTPDLQAVRGPAGYADVPSIELSAPAANHPSGSMLLVYPSDATDSSRNVFSSSFDMNAAAGSNSSQNGPQTASAISHTSPVGGVITGLDTVPTFAGAFAAQA